MARTYLPRVRTDRGLRSSDAMICHKDQQAGTVHRRQQAALELAKLGCPRFQGSKRSRGLGFAVQGLLCLTLHKTGCQDSAECLVYGASRDVKCCSKWAVVWLISSWLRSFSFSFLFCSQRRAQLPSRSRVCGKPSGPPQALLTYHIGISMRAFAWYRCVCVPLQVCR